MFLQKFWVAFQTYGELLSSYFDIIPIEKFRTLLLRHLKAPPKSAKRSSKFLSNSQQHRQGALIMTFYSYVELQGWQKSVHMLPAFSHINPCQSMPDISSN